MYGLSVIEETKILDKEESYKHMFQGIQKVKISQARSGLESMI